MRFYQQRLLDPRWQKKRLEVLSRDNWTCQFCLSQSKTLDVHHCRYRQGVAPWDYPLADLLTLCRDCHEAETKHNNAPHLRAAGLVRELRKIGPRRSEPPAKPPDAPLRLVPPAPAVRQRPASGYFAATREGMKKITVAITPDRHRRLKILSVDRGGIEKSVAEAIDDWFAKHGINDAE